MRAWAWMRSACVCSAEGSSSRQLGQYDIFVAEAVFVSVGDIVGVWLAAAVLVNVELGGEAIVTTIVVDMARGDGSMQCTV